MLKRNKLSIFLVAVVMMLTVYYIKTPVDVSEEPVDNDIVINRYPAYAERRMELLTERTDLIKNQEIIIAGSSSIGIDTRRAALAEIQTIHQLTEKEVAMETAIINIGYDDALVVFMLDEAESIADSRIVSANVRVLSTSLSKEEIADICSLVMAESGAIEVCVEINGLEN